MKRWIKNCLAAGAGCVVAGALLFAVGFLNGGKNYVLAADLNQWKGSATKEDSTYGLEKTKIDDYSTLNVDLSSLNLQIVSSDDDSYYISYTTSDSKEKEPVSYDVKNKILTLKEDSDSNSYTHIDIGFLTAFLSKDKDFTTDENVVTLYVPTDARFQSANINSSFGDILINSSCFESGKISSDDGEIFIKNSTLKDVTVSASFGDVKTYDSKIKACNFELSDGDFVAKDSEFTGENSISSSFGDIDIEAKKEQLLTLGFDASTGFGDIEVPDFLEGKLHEEDVDESSYQRNGKDGNLKLQADDGDIVIKLNK
ncbi:DUF4097 family beta strand repeat-containing protein [Blautia stercoris]|uniref:DUF4097 family beta strand repeat protein n=1 Tax=Blautia stercoris TaxID=871664 RepID=A0ABR7PDA2_9FIRM|nr:DUF4097 family beta strand repeat-containing protein [Blautia stercoris]MBC8629412.1 DUF4097 family beta strand repeat protein [Blautia stercoris]